MMSRSPPGIELGRYGKSISVSHPDELAPSRSLILVDAALQGHRLCDRDRPFADRQLTAFGLRRRCTDRSPGCSGTAGELSVIPV